MVFSYALSWLLNAAAVSVVLAIIDEGKRYGIEKNPALVFALVAALPALLELIAFIFEEKPFLSLIWPGFTSLI